MPKMAEISLRYEAVTFIPQPNLEATVILPCRTINGITHLRNVGVTRDRLFHFGQIHEHTLGYSRFLPVAKGYLFLFLLKKK